jgi:hypothetical protein
MHGCKQHLKAIVKAVREEKSGKMTVMGVPAG